MQPDIHIPRSAIPFILLQRTDLQAWRRLIRPISGRYYPYVCRAESIVRRTAIARRYLQQIQADFERIMPFLPLRVSRIIDIGCGVASIDVLLFRHYKMAFDLTFLLLDRDEVSPQLSYRFKSTPEFYSSLGVARELLVSNGVGQSQIMLIDASTAQDFRLPQLDLVVSLFAWGFHFPLSTYLDQICHSLAPAGTIILDIRKGTEGERELQRRFAEINTVSETPKARRVAVRLLR